MNQVLKYQLSHEFIDIDILEEYQVLGKGASEHPKILNIQTTRLRLPKILKAEELPKKLPKIANNGNGK